MKIDRFLSKDLNSFLILAIISMVFYANTLQNGFVYDDPFQIRQNPLIQNLSDLPNVTAGCLLGVLSADCNSIGLFYRPLALIVNLLTNQISYEPWAFHLRNIIFMSGISILAYKFFRHFSGKNIYPFLAAVLFVINPINSEVVNFVSAVHDLLFAGFFLISLLAFIKYSKINNIYFLLASSVAYFFAVLSKETAIILFLIMPIYQYLFVPLQKNKAIKKYAVILAAYLIPIGLYLLLRNAVLGREVIDSKGYHDLTILQSFLSGIAIYPLYLIKLIYPIPLNAQHDPPVLREIDIRFFMGIAAMIITSGAIYFSFKKKLKIALLGLTLIILPLVPVLIFVNRVGRFVLAERWLFIPTIGFSLILIDLVERYMQKLKPKKAQNLRKILLSGLAAYMAVSWVIVFQRNQDWRDEFSFNKSIAANARENFGVHYNLGINYRDRGEYRQAVGSFEKSLAINPEFWQAHYNMAYSYLNLGQEQNALEEYSKALSLNPDFSSAAYSIENINIINSGTQSAKLKYGNFGNTKVISYNGNDLSFIYPVYFKLAQQDEKILLGSSNNFKIEISPDNKKPSLSARDYIKAQDQDLGKLINKGPAQIPDFDFAYVKVFESTLPDQVTSFSFFLFKGEKVINLTAFAVSQDNKKDLDLILSSVRPVY